MNGEVAFRRGVYIITPIWKREGDVIRNLIVLFQAHYGVGDADRIMHNPEIMEGRKKGGRLTPPRGLQLRHPPYQFWWLCRPLPHL